MTPTLRPTQDRHVLADLVWDSRLPTHPSHNFAYDDDGGRCIFCDCRAGSARWSPLPCGTHEDNFDAVAAHLLAEHFGWREDGRPNFLDRLHPHDRVKLARAGIVRLGGTTGRR